MASTKALDLKMKELRGDNRALRSDLSEAADAMAMLEPQCFSTMGRIGLMAAGGATAFVGGKLAAYVQQKGGPAFAWDGIVGAGMQLGAAFGESRTWRFVESEGRALFEGAMGRFGYMSQLERTEINGRVALLLPSPAPANNGAK